MELRARKLLYIQENEPSFSFPQSGILSNSSSALTQHPNYDNNNGGFSLSPPFDSSMALTILLLLTALFFMGFFSIYLRRFADTSSSSIEPYRFRRRGAATRKGVDPKTVNSLPMKMAEGEFECSICLSEFEQGERMKTIPFCGHVFHVECIDTWLKSHVTCPLCRTVRLFPEVRVAIGCDARGEEAVGSTVEEGDTCNEECGVVVS